MNNSSTVQVKPCYTYILRCADGSFYTGWTFDLSRRIHQHNTGQGSRYVRSRLPAVLAGFLVLDSKSEAMKLERRIKTMTRQQKEEFLNQLSSEEINDRP
jgi:putative endonuclease